MREITVMDPARRIGAARVRFGKTDPGANMADLYVACRTDGHMVSVLLDHHSAVWLMAALGAFAAGVGQPPLEAITARDVDGRQTAAIQLHHDAGPIAVLHITNNAARATAAVALDRRMATALMAELGAFVAAT
jgi:hypothetical protein